MPFLTDNIRDKVISHILDNARSKYIFIDQINGSLQHLHALISLGGSQSLSEIMHKIKGESSYWINKNKLTRLKFEWQDDYYCISLGFRQLEIVRKYIRNQEQHHKTVSWEEELMKLNRENNFSEIKL
jgi:putative transposase